ncbi:uncharacterized protein LOC121404806 [Drosophila obscura]|uniref:uncharacterized protein LOC121404806 n=1 Tax=Drosophila obscura TaxID=7282 RepID=UPI001BB1944D|nr:uncharacterized protein LOC121404806 [Drosophila obscura]
MYDGVLRLNLPEGTTIVGFADDAAIAVVAKDLVATEAAANEAIRAVETWLDLAGLQLAAHKTEAVLFSSRKKVVSSYMRGAEATHRLCAIRIACALKTVSDDAALVIAGLIPIVEQARKRAAAHELTLAGQVDTREAREARRQESIRRWQAKWDSSTKGRWTHKLIPDLKAWIDRKNGQVDFHLTQILSGHGCFRSYLKRFGHETEDWLEVALGTRVSAEGLVRLMVSDPEAWDAIAQFAAGIMREFRGAERERRATVD